MEIVQAGSSSLGNSYAIRCSDSDLLIEAGVRFDVLKQKLDHDISKVKLMIVSHIHLDHFKHIQQYLDAGIDCYIHQDMVTESKIKPHPFLNIYETEKLFRVGGFGILPIKMNHNVVTHGFVINHHEFGNLFFATDTSYIFNKIADMNYIMIEANYSDEIILGNIKKLGLNPVHYMHTFTGHHSIDNCIAWLQRNDLSKVKQIMLIHLSSGNSNAVLFKEMIEKNFGIICVVADER